MIEFKENGKELVILLKGRLDANNAGDVEAQIIAKMEECSPETVICDASELEYISSAGLRVVLRLRKTNDTLRIIGVSPEVYEIFEMTGFSELIPIEKAFRQVSVDGCEVIGVGANGTVYRLDPETIIKAYRPGIDLSDIKREQELARTAFVKGIPTAISYDVVKVGESYGSVFELLNAKSLTKLILADPDSIDTQIQTFVDLMKQIHSTPVSENEMPCMKDVAIDWVDFLKPYLEEGLWNKLKALFEAIPNSHTMLHGDYHTKNVMVQNGETLLIDMDTLAYGNPVFEMGSVYNAYVGFSVLDHSIIEKFQGFSFETGQYIWNEILKRYFETDDPNVLKEKEDKAIVVGYTRLLRRSIRRGALDSEEGKQQLAYYVKEIEERLTRLDNLAY